MGIPDLVKLEGLAFDVTGFVLVKATLVLGLVWLLCRIARRASAPTRYSLWAIGFAGLLVTPWLPYVLPESGLRVLPQWSLPVLPAAFMNMDIGAAVGPVVGSEGQSRGGAPFVPLFVVGFVIWIAGAVHLLGRLGGDLVRVRAMTRAAEPAPPGVAKLAERLSRAAGIRRRVHVLVSARTPVPLTWGQWRPAIILPWESRGWSRDRTEAVLRHELAHVKRSDFLGLLLIEVGRSLYWVNPLARLGARLSRLEQEIACDEAAVLSGISPAAYARHLLEVARGSAATAIPRSALAMARPSTLRTRIRSILEVREARCGRAARVGAAALLVALSGSIGAAGVNPWICPEATGSTTAAGSAAPRTGTSVPSA